MQYECVWRNKWLTADASSIPEMAAALEEAARELRQMERDGVALDPGSGMEDDYASLVTTDPAVARKYGFMPVEMEEDVGA